uniref:Uncharacterized protein n=2 Tax=root TaxID=1 RepID=A0A481YYY6_9VIRU|nr:MAG: hypothetical protein LCMAC202_00120 [Marseillevirus LCMAC202]
MSTYVGRVGSCCNNYNYQNGMFLGPYLVQDMNASVMKPRIKPYSGWASYKNVKSGQYNRQLCWTCGDFKGYPQTAGVYDLNIVDTPPPMPDYQAMANADEYYQIYQAERMSNHPGSYGAEYVNYLNNECGALYPKRYVKGNWPDEQLIYTNTPANGCNTVAAGKPVCGSS